MYGALIYQSAVAVTENDSTALHHNMRIIVRDAQDGMQPMHIQYQVPVGVVSKNPTRQMIKTDFKDIPADGYHLYSRSKVYDAVEFPGVNCQLSFRAQPGADHIGVMLSPDGQRLELKMGHGDHTEVMLFS